MDGQPQGTIPKSMPSDMIRGWNSVFGKDRAQTRENSRRSDSAKPNQTPGRQNFFLAGAGLSSAILDRQSSCVVWGPGTKVPLPLVLYHPETTPRRSDSSVLT